MLNRGYCIRGHICSRNERDFRLALAHQRHRLAGGQRYADHCAERHLHERARFQDGVDQPAGPERRLTLALRAEQGMRMARVAAGHGSVDEVLDPGSNGRSDQTARAVESTLMRSSLPPRRTALAVVITV